jgi:SpoVK/Ycf46/Vps4 family AAA+-type ATPase
LEQNKIKLSEADIKSITVLFLYNKSFDEIKIKGLDFKTNKTVNPKQEELSFVPIIPKYRLDQVILSDNLEKEIKKALTILEYREKIYETWGFGEIEPSPKAILNFYGPSGTGKTMTSHAVANYLNIKIMALNYADIESKFVGDAPKNLIKAFESASRENALLFFDEADSFLGKRITNISSSSDQAVNSLRSQLLILLENFEGIVIFATNLMDNYDKAFESRIFKHLKFDLPDEKGRKELISKSIPRKVPFKDKKSLSNDELIELSKITPGLSGRHIKNGILNALTNAVISDKDVLSYQDFYDALLQVKQSMDDINSKGTTTKLVLDNKRKKELENRISEKLKQRNKQKKYLKRR